MKTESFSVGCRPCEVSLSAIQEGVPELDIGVNQATECVVSHCYQRVSRLNVMTLSSPGRMVLAGLSQEIDLQGLEEVLNLE